MSTEVQLILQRCSLGQHYQYLCTKGFTNWDSLQLLDQSDYEQLQAIPYGHFKLLIQTIQKYAKEQNISTDDHKLRPKYKQFLKSLNKISKPAHLFDNVDQQIAKYHEIKQTYTTQWAVHQQYHTKISNFIKTNTQSEIDTPLNPEALRKFITSMQKLNGELQQLLQNMGNTNYDITNNDDLKVDTDTNIKPSNAKLHKKRTSKRKKKEATPTNWMVDEESSLVQDVKLYSKINLLKIKDMSNGDWKIVAAQHNENFWNNTPFKGRSYKECRSRYKTAPITGIDTAAYGMKGEVDEPSDEETDGLALAYGGNGGVQLQMAGPGSGGDNGSSSSDEDDLGLLSMMQAPPQ